MKKPTHYFVFTGHSTQTKNNLQEEFMTFLKALQGTLIDADNLPRLQEMICAKASELNHKYHRCKALVISFSELYSKNGFMISGFYFLTFQIIEAYYDTY